MESHSRYGFAALVLGATAAVIAGCFSDYHGDCGRDPDLDCFWGSGTGGSGGSGGTGGGGTTVTTTAVIACGDGQKDPGEACDDGNKSDCDGCRGDCSAVETGCGDGFVCGGEECDDGAQNSDTGACTTMCKQATCGDGFLQGGEECDDGNVANGDNCSDECKLECTIGNLPFGDNPANFAMFLDADTMHCYAHISKPQKSWTGARSACQAWGGDLFAFSDTLEEGLVIAGTNLSGESWVGGSDVAGDGVFTWSSGETWPDGAPWASGEPNQAGVGCVGMAATGMLNDHDCGQVLPGGYICELDLGTLK